MFLKLWSSFCRENTLHKLKKSGGVTFGNERPLVTEMVCVSFMEGFKKMAYNIWLPVLSPNKTIWFLTMQCLE